MTRTRGDLFDWAIADRILQRLRLLEFDNLGPRMRELLTRQVARLYADAREAVIKPPSIPPGPS